MFLSEAARRRAVLPETGLDALVDFMFRVASTFAMTLSHSLRARSRCLAVQP